MSAATASTSPGTTGLERRPASAREGRGAAERSPSHRPLRSKITAGALVALAVGGLALGRFVFLDGSDGGAPLPSAASSPADQIASLESAVEADPDDLRSHQLLGAAYLRRAAETGDPSYYGLASRALERAEEIAPGDPETNVVAGGLALARHQFADALALGAAASRANASDPDALVVMVDAQIELGRYDEARETLDRLLGTRPGLAAFTRLSYYEQLHGNTARAVLTMQEAESAGSSPFDRAVAATFLGDLRFGAGDFDKADAAYRRALDRSPGLVLAELGRARVLEARGERAEAVEVLSALTERYPQPAALALLGELHQLDGRTAEAEQAYQLARASQGSIAASGGVVDLETALFEADHGDPAVALDLAEAAYAERSTVYTADALAWALHRSGRSAEAVPYVEESVALGTADPLLRFHAADVLAAAGDAARAREHLSSALGLNPRFSPFHQARADQLAQILGVAT